MAVDTRVKPTLILNCRAGVREQLSADELKELFAARGAELDVLPCGEGDDLCELARQALRQNARLIVAAGGDGTIGAVASVVAGTDAALGVLPLGTLNHFAKDLGIPTTIDEAVATVVHGRTARVDIGEVNGRTFVNNSSIGLYPTLVRNREAQQRLGRGKWTAFLRAMLTAVGRYPLIHVEIKCNGQRLSRRTPLLFIGNNDYHIHGLNLGRRDRLDAGRLSIYVTRDVGRRKLIWFGLRALFGLLRETVDFDCVETDEATIAVHRPSLKVATDGEVTRLSAPLEYRIRPGALAVRVPAADAGVPT